MLSPDKMVNVRKSCETMYNHTCDIYGSKEVVQDNGATAFKDVLLYGKQPCHISQSVTTARGKEAGNYVSSAINLYIAPDINIPAGSRIICNGKMYKQSGAPAMYGAFQKIQLEYIGDYA